MKRRDFTKQVGSLALGSAGTAGLGLSILSSTWLASPALAQGGPVEGKDFLRLKDPVAVASSGKIEVLEFFGYWCPHCASFEPVLEAWVKALPADIHFRRIPVAFSVPQEFYQKLYFGIEALGQVPALHGKVFAAMHGQRQRLDKDGEISALATAHGVDGAKLLDAMKSFSVATKINQARQLLQAYKVDSVPMLAVHGRFTTSPSTAGTPERALQVVEWLAQRAKRG